MNNNKFVELLFFYLKKKWENYEFKQVLFDEKEFFYLREEEKKIWMILIQLENCFTMEGVEEIKKKIDENIKIKEDDKLILAFCTMKNKFIFYEYKITNTII